MNRKMRSFSLRKLRGKNILQPPYKAAFVREKKVRTEKPRVHEELFEDFKALLTQEVTE